MSPGLFRLRIKAAVEEEGGQKAFAEKHGLSPAYLNDVLLRGKAPGKKICDALGYERVTEYRPKRTDKPLSEYTGYER